MLVDILLVLLFMSKCHPPETERQASLSDGVERALEERIISRKWPVGFRLPSEGKLCEEFGVSRTAVREALRELRGRGLVETLNGSGSYVAAGKLETVSRAITAYSSLTVDSKSAIEMIDFRGVIEAAALSSLSLRSNKVVVRKMTHLLDKMKAEQRSGRFMQLCAKFHIAIVESYPNDLVRIVGKSMYRRYAVTAANNYLMNEIIHQELVDEHGAILTAVCEKDAKTALAALEKHLAGAKLREKRLFSAA